MSSMSPAVDVPDGYTVLEGTPSGQRRSVAVVVSRYNGALTNRMLARARRRSRTRASRRTRSRSCRFRCVRAAARAVALAKSSALRVHGGRARRDRGRGDAAFRLRRLRGGIRGSSAAIETGVPVAFGVLTVETIEQAEAKYRPRRPTPSRLRSRWPTCSRSSAPAPAAEPPPEPATWAGRQLH